MFGNSVEYYTPEWLLERVYRVFPIDLDPCSDPSQHVKARVHYTEGGLDKEWFGNIFLNPPYGRGIGKWTEKVIGHEAIALVPVKSDTGWWNALMEHARCWCGVRGRIQFISPDGKKGNGTFASAVVLLTSDDAVEERFIQEFRDLGHIWRINYARRN